MRFVERVRQTLIQVKPLVLQRIQESSIASGDCR